MIYTRVSTPAAGIARAAHLLAARGLDPWDQLSAVSGFAVRDLRALVSREAFALAPDMGGLGAALESAGLSPALARYHVANDLEGDDEEEDRYRFVLSTALPDRATDIVEQDWDLADFRRNPVAPFGHDTVSPPIGTWESVKVEGGALRGVLVPAPVPSYPISMTVAEYLRRGVMRTVSVGFAPRSVIPRAALRDDPRAGESGYVFAENVLFECSVVTLPMNAGAEMERAKVPEPPALEVDWLTG